MHGEIKVNIKLLKTHARVYMQQLKETHNKQYSISSYQGVLSR